VHVRHFGGGPPPVKAFDAEAGKAAAAERDKPFDKRRRIG
jgi:hypothetical protein